MTFRYIRYGVQLFPNIFIPQKEASYHEAVIPHSFLLQALSTTSLPFVSMELHVFHVNRITQYVAPGIWLLSLNIMFSRFIQVVACVTTSLPFMAE